MEPLERTDSIDELAYTLERISSVRSHLANLAMWDIESPNIIRAEE